jgi:hypothetical protein
MTRLIALAAIAAALVFLPSALAGANHTVVVDNDLADCPNADTTSIQAGVLLAEPGDLVLVCEGTYVEDVTVTLRTAISRSKRRDHSAASSSTARTR